MSRQFPRVWAQSPLDLDRLRAWLSFWRVLAWPLALVLFACLFRAEGVDLTRRLTRGEIAGTRFEFEKAAAGYIKERVDVLAAEPDPARTTIMDGWNLGTPGTRSISMLLNDSISSASDWTKVDTPAHRGRAGVYGVNPPEGQR